MKKKLVTSLLSVIATGVVLVLALISAFPINRSIAWLAQNHSVGANGINVSVSTDHEAVQLKAHPISQIDQSTQTYTVVGDVERYELPMNDPNDISYSEYKKALAVIIDFTCSAPADIDVYLTSPTEGVSIAEDNFISNCIEVAPATLSAGGSSATVNGNFKSLVTVAADGSCTKNPSVLLQSITIPEGSTTLCFILRYNEDFLTYISNRVLAEGGTYFQIDYRNDITFSIE